jgi:ABC-type transporter Mla MlaB component
MDDQFDLPADLTIYGVLDIRDALLAWVAEQTEKSTPLLKVSAKDVESVDGAGLQLLASLGSMEVTWQLSDTSAAFSEACTTMGLSHWLTQAKSAATGA